MPRILRYTASIVLASLACATTANADCTVAWNQLLSTHAEHEECVRDFGDDISHFARTWRSSGGWSGAEGYMRWRVVRTMGEDDDGYYINHPPTTSRSVFISFVARVGSTWWSSHTGNDRFKFVMFYPATGKNPRPTIFSMPIHSSYGTYSYRTFGPDVAAGGQGCDQFGNCNHDQTRGYPRHAYQEGAGGHDQWYFIVMSLEGNRTRTYVWSQDGKIGGQFAQSLPADASLLDSWNAQTWRTVRLLAYIESTTAGDENAYMDIGHIRVTQSLPSLPAGFVRGLTAEAPEATGNIRF